MESRLSAVLDRVPKRAALAVRDSGALILWLAVDQTPIKDGPLRESGYLIVGGRLCAKGQANGDISIVGSPPHLGSGNVVSTIGFNTPYALVQHERLDFNHPRGGKAKYLEDAIRDSAAEHHKRVADQLRDELRRK
jgi:hypothetical protein